MSTPDTSSNAAISATKAGYPWVRHGLAVAIAVGIGYVVASGIHHWRHSQQQPNADILASLIANSAANAASAPAVSQPTQVVAQSRSAALAPRLTATMIVNGNRIDNPEQVALPSNSVFALSLQANRNGSLAVFAINPEGNSTPIWSGRLQAGQDLHTPNMRLQGVRGLETLRIVFSPDLVNGQSPATVVRELEILHV